MRVVSESPLQEENHGTRTSSGSEPEATEVFTTALASNWRALLVYDRDKQRQWQADVQEAVGGPEKHKELSLADEASHGVVAALISTIVVAIMMLGTNNYCQTNQYNTVAKYIQVSSMVLALMCSLACINVSTQAYCHILLCPAEELIDFLVKFKGKFYLESIAMVNASIVLLMVGSLSLVYLLYGGILVLISSGLAIAFFIHTVFVFNYFHAHIVHMYEHKDKNSTTEHTMVLPFKQMNGKGAAGEGNVNAVTLIQETPASLLMRSSSTGSSNGSYIAVPSAVH